MKRHESDQRHAAAFRARQKIQAVVEAKAWKEELQKMARRGRGRSDVPSMPFRLPSTGMKKKKKKKKRGRPQVRWRECCALPVSLSLSLSLTNSTNDYQPNTYQPKTRCLPSARDEARRAVVAGRRAPPRRVR